MAAHGKGDFDLVTDICLVAYDAQSGEILSVHEFMSEKGPEVESYCDRERERVHEQTARMFEKRSIKVLTVPTNIELDPKKSYWIDPLSEEIRELSDQPRQGLALHPAAAAALSWRR